MAKVTIKRYKTRFDRENDQNGDPFNKVAHTVDQLNQYAVEAHSNDSGNSYLNFFDENGDRLQDLPSAARYLE